MSEELEKKAEETSSAEAEKAVGQEDEKSAEIQKEELIEESKQIQEEAEQLAEEDKKADHKEKSRIGRRVSLLELRMQDFFDRMEPVIQSAAQKGKTIDDDTPLDVNTVRQLLEEKEQKDTEEAKRYGNQYARTIDEIGIEEEDEEMHLKVTALITGDSEFNVKSDNDPARAAEKNYRKALRHLQKEGSTKKPTVNLNKNNDKLPPAGDKTKTKATEDVDIELDEAAKEYAKRTGMTPERIKKIMKDKTPIYASGTIIQ